MRCLERQRRLQRLELLPRLAIRHHRLGEGAAAQVPVAQLQQRLAALAVIDRLALVDDVQRLQQRPLAIGIERADCRRDRWHAGRRRHSAARGRLPTRSGIRADRSAQCRAAESRRSGRACRPLSRRWSGPARALRGRWYSGRCPPASARTGRVGRASGRSRCRRRSRQPSARTAAPSRHRCGDRAPRSSVISGSR